MDINENNVLNVNVERSLANAKRSYGNDDHTSANVGRSFRYVVRSFAIVKRAYANVKQPYCFDVRSFAIDGQSYHNEARVYAIITWSVGNDKQTDGCDSQSYVCANHTFELAATHQETVSAHIAKTISRTILDILQLYRAFK